MCDTLEVWVHECALHSTLWKDPHTPHSTAISPARALMLQRSLSASQKFVRDFIAAPSTALYQVPLPIWTGWFYSTLVIVKLIFLHDSGGTGALGMNSVPCEMSDLLPPRTGAEGTEGVYEMTSTLSATSLRDPSMAAREADAVMLFQAFAEKVMAAGPEAQNTATASAPAKDKSLFTKVGMLQHGLLAGLRKRLEKPRPVVGASTALPEFDAQVGGAAAAAAAAAAVPQQQQFSGPGIQTGQYEIPPYSDYIEPAALLGFPQGQELPVDDWVWDLVMDDVNMFNM